MVLAFYRSSRPSLPIFWQKSKKNRKVFEILPFSLSIVGSFRLKNCIFLFSKDTGRHILSFSTLFNVLDDEVCEKFGKKSMKSLKIEKFWDFYHFLCK